MRYVNDMLLKSNIGCFFELSRGHERTKERRKIQNESNELLKYLLKEKKLQKVLIK